MNKNAQMLSAIFGLIIAAILISFAIKIGSDVFRLSGQAQSNFEQLAQTIRDVNNKTPGTLQKDFFYLDQKTYVYMINNVSRGMHVTKSPFFSTSVDFTLSTPPECADQNCLCLCRKYKGEKDRGCLEIMCEPLPGVDFSNGTGVILDRGTEGPRRQEVTIYKCLGGESYCKKSKAGDVSIIFSWADSKGVYNPIK
ncbi:MAG: hypothetical protein V2A62_05610 [Candidatus Woesearchaeota archaeon]